MQILNYITNIENIANILLISLSTLYQFIMLNIYIYISIKYVNIIFEIFKVFNNYIKIIVLKKMKYD